MKGKIKTRLIHILGGYTQQEYDKLRFAPMPVIKEKTVYPVTVTEHNTLAKIFWDRLITTAKYNHQHKYWFDFSDSRFYKFKVIAWAEKPEPYKP